MLTDLYTLIEANPADWETRLIIADWCEENGMEELAALQRWLVEKRRHAELTSDFSMQRYWPEEIFNTAVYRVPGRWLRGAKFTGLTHQSADLALAEIAWPHLRKINWQNANFIC